MKAHLFNTIPSRDMLGFWADHTLKARSVADFLELPKADIAKVSGVSTSSVRFDEKIPREVLQRLTEIATICGLVAQFFEGNAVKTALWFKTRNPLLGNVSPRDMIRYGRIEKLHQIINDALLDSESE